MTIVNFSRSAVRHRLLAGIFDSRFRGSSSGVLVNRLIETCPSNIPRSLNVSDSPKRCRSR
jgi:hypothetical protein